MTRTTTTSQSEYAGLVEDGGQLSSENVPLPESRIKSYVMIAVCVASIRFLYAFSKLLSVIAFCVFVGVALCKMDTSSSSSRSNSIPQEDLDEDAQMRLRMDRINREREESEAMVLDAARMMLDINRRHLSEFLITHPYATYEEWIAKLHPDNVTTTTTTTTTTKSNNGGGGDGNKSQQPAISIDHRFYVEDSDHRQLWNEMIEDEREFVPVRSLGDYVQDVV